MVVRIRDVAAKAGVSPATVSLALAGSQRISSATRERVAEVARELGYQPHSGARALRTTSTHTIGLVVSDVANPFFAELAGEFQRVAARAGYSTLLCNSDEDARRQDEYLASLVNGSRVDGVVLVPTATMTPGLRAAGEARARLVLLDRPVVVQGRSAAERHLGASPVVRSDAAAALDEAADLLVRLGHRRIGVIAPPLQTQVGQERRDLFREALVRRGVARRDVAVVEGDFRQDSGARAVAQLLTRRQPPTAFFAADGLMAIGALQGFRAAGLRVPHDVSLIGFDDAPWFDVVDPPLTVIAQPVTELAHAAVGAVLDLIAGRTAAGSHPQCRLVSRNSCGVPPTADIARPGAAKSAARRRSERNPS